MKTPEAKHVACPFCGYDSSLNGPHLGVPLAVGCGYICYDCGGLATLTPELALRPASVEECGPAASLKGGAA